MPATKCLIIMTLIATTAISVNGQPTTMGEDRIHDYYDYSLNFVKIHESLENIQQSIVRRNRSSTTNPKSSCPPGFTYTVTDYPKCYSVVTELLNWTAAQAKCRQLHPDAHLAIVSTALENQILSTILNEHECRGGGDTFWTSGQRRNFTCDSTFAWKPKDGVNLELGFRNWCPGEPSCGNGQHCMIITKKCYYNRAVEGWDDDHCYESVCSVCEVKRF